MESLKKVLNVLVMVYLITVFLFLLRILSVSKFVALFDMTDNAEFFNRMLWAGAILLLAELIVENAYIATLKRGLDKEHRQITELKAQLYDQRLKATPPPVTTVPDPTWTKPADTTYTQSTSHHRLDDNIEEDQGPIITPAPIPPTLNPDENPNLPPTDHRPHY
ncbi:hypothetical protein TH63_19610 [Rufibacter radiotolerans]|uniref:Uncharacterized protein n=1 Tax=Rufibacter radiotolerans TaxID=1379910 RepID=A0A0H4VTT7_9BACT|nr:hypothetical protein [Rufibacter radiotolerans]AKQ47357.1 hypothetical protein TH63_19610 [Rufibacter radiotolerans]